MIYYMTNFWKAAIHLHFYTYYPPRLDFISHDSIFSSWVMIIPEKGTFEWRSNDAEGKEISGNAAFGDLVCVPPKIPLWRRVTSPSLEYHVFQWSFLHQAGKKIDNFPRGNLSIRDTTRLLSTLEILKIIHGKTDDWSYRRQSHLLEEVLHLAWQTQVELKRVIDPEMNEAAKLLRKRAGDIFSMEEISRQFGLGQVQLTRRFRAAHGYNPIEFLTKMRLEIAQQLLIETNLPLDEIAFRCGWSSGAYLSHVFKKQMLITPGHFRNSQRI
jgi:AraC-like DNA-binding protein